MWWWYVSLTGLGDPVCVLSWFSHVWLCKNMDWSLSGSSVHGISQLRILEWVAMLFSRRSCWSRDRSPVSYVSCTGGQVLHHYHHLERRPRELVKHYFWVCLWGCFQEEISLWLCGLSLDGGSHRCVCASSSLLRVCVGRRGGGRVNLLSAWASTSIFSCLWISSVLGFRPFGLGWNYIHHHWLSWASSLQTANRGPSQPPIIMQADFA